MDIQAEIAGVENAALSMVCSHNDSISVCLMGFSARPWGYWVLISQGLRGFDYF